MHLRILIISIFLLISADVYAQNYSGLSFIKGKTRINTSIPMSVIFEGDSITNGGGGSSFLGIGDWYAYRKSFQLTLKDFYVITSFGNYSSPNPTGTFGSPTPDPAITYTNDGNPGDYISTIQTRLSTTKNSLSSISTGKQVVVINAGTNNVSAGNDPATVISGIVGNGSAMVETVYAYNPNIETYVMLLNPRTDSHASDQVTFNSVLLSALQTSQGTHPNLHIVDTQSALNNTTLCPTLAGCLMPDGFHPNPYGMFVIGSVTANCVMNNLSQYCDGH